MTDPFHTHAHSFSERIIATDLLFTTKGLIQQLAAALTETTATELRMFLKQELDQAIAYQTKMLHYLVDKDWCDPDNLEQQLQADLLFVAKVVALPGKTHHSCEETGAD
jgi:spore coat protein CotF